MPVYVDRQSNQFGRMKMCHMLADTLDELHLMADKIGVNRKWFQANASTPHYDICKQKRKIAVECGAIEITRRETVALIRKLRATQER